MNKAEKATVKAHLDAEAQCLKDLEQSYKKAKKDCQDAIRALNARKKLNDPNLASVVHQKKYQEALLKQIDGVLNTLQTNTFTTADEFFRGSYQDGYIGSMYEMHHAGIPLVIPISPQRMQRAIQTDSKLSDKYYLKKGLSVTNIKTLKKKIASEVTSLIASGQSWLQASESMRVQRSFTVAQSDSMRIVRTEGNRINQQARLDAGDDAVKAGCDLVKIWDATLDSRTRPAHAEADGQIVEWGEDFTVMGEQLPCPGVHGSASNVINCRCQLLKKPKWALDEDELSELQKRAEFFGLDKTKDFEEFRDKYLKLPDDAQKKKIDYTERRKQRLQERQSKMNQFVPATDMKEVRTRLSSALGIDENVINLGRMKVELANQYLDGVETFMHDFPQMKGLYTGMNTKRCNGGVLGINALEGKGRYVGRSVVYDCTFELGLKSPKDLGDLVATYNYAVDSAQQYKGASPKATAIHELVHGLTHAIQMKKKGYFKDGTLRTTIYKNEWDDYSRTNCFTLVSGVKQELYGALHGREVFEGMMHLGSYAMTNADETVAQAVSYEYVNPSNSKEFSKKVFEALKNEVKETFK